MSLRARERDDVVDGEEVGLVAELGDQRELVLDQLADVGRAAPSPIAPREPGLGELRAGATRASRPAARSPRDTRSAARRARMCSARRSPTRLGEQRAADRASRAARASAGAARRWGRARSRIRRAACCRRIAVSVSCSARRARACMWTSPAATCGSPRRARQRRAAREPRAVAGAGEELDRDPGAAGKRRGDPVRGRERRRRRRASRRARRGIGRHPQREQARRERGDVVARRARSVPFFAWRRPRVMSCARLP